MMIEVNVKRMFLLLKYEWMTSNTGYCSFPVVVGIYDDLESGQDAARNLIRYYRPDWECKEARHFHETWPPSEDIKLVRADWGQFDLRTLDEMPL